MKKSAPDAPLNYFNQQTFAGILNLWSLLNDAELSTVDKTTVTDTLRKAKDRPIYMGGGTKYTCDGKALASVNQPAPCSTSIYVFEVKNGVLTPHGPIDGAPLLA